MQTTIGLLIVLGVALSVTHSLTTHADIFRGEGDFLFVVCLFTGLSYAHVVTYCSCDDRQKQLRYEWSNAITSYANNAKFN